MLAKGPPFGPYTSKFGSSHLGREVSHPKEDPSSYGLSKRLEAYIS